jgi:hypothetical protein
MSDTKVEHPVVEATPVPVVGHVVDQNAPQEAKLTFRQALKLHKKAIAWSAYVSIGVIMLAFDPQLLGNLYAITQFANDFGQLVDGEVSLTRDEGRNKRKRKGDKKLTDTVCYL